jgi:uncharacterized protein (DUF2249 family)
MMRRAPGEAERRKRDYALAHIRALLARDGCPVCHEISDHDPTYFFWFFNENYYESFTLDALTRSLGFCRAHATYLMQTPGGAYPLAAVYQVLARRIRRTLAGDSAPAGQRRRRPERFEIIEPCPPCASVEDAAARAVFWTAQVLEDASASDLYGRPGLLCLRHLQAIIPRVSRTVFDRLFVIHVDALESAAKDLADEHTAGASAVHADALAARLRVTVGHGRPTVYPRFAEPVTPADPVGGFLEALRAGRGCAVCAELRRAWMELGRWLDAAALDGRPIDDLLPACADHVWAMAERGDRALKLAIARRSLALTSAHLAVTWKLLHEVPTLRPRQIVARVRERFMGRRLRDRRARDFVARSLDCPVCRRLAGVEQRAVSLWFALLEHPHHRAAIEQGDGLCLQHLVRAMPSAPPGLRPRVAEVERARLAVLEWELEEMLRKAGWPSRPERRGTESTAWARAMEKFSGTWTEPGEGLVTE